MFLVTLAGALLAGAYGVLHDQVTYRISEEYFTRNKFDQFYYARPASGSELEFASRIGFLATWWVGALTAWGLARVSVAQVGRVAPVRVMGIAFVIVFSTSALVAVGGWLWGLWRTRTGYAMGWVEWMEALGVEDRSAFMSVGYIHNASYLGGILGMVLGIVYLRLVFRRQQASA
jgi:hypothetical protein